MQSNAPAGDQNEILKSFIAEGIDLLDNVEPSVIELQSTFDASGAVDAELVNSIFRLFHSLKGSAGFLALNNISKVTHEAETLLDLFRTGKAALQPDHVDLLCATCDFIRKLLRHIDETGSDAGCEGGAEAMQGKLQQAIDSIGRSAAQPQAAPADLISPEMRQRFAAEAEEQLQTLEDALLELEKNPGRGRETVEHAFRAIHSFKGNCGFMGLGDLERVSHKSETILEQFRSGEAPAPAKTVQFLLSIVDVLHDGLANLSAGGNGEIENCAAIVELLDDILRNPPAAQSNKPLGEILVEQGHATPDDVHEALNTQNTPLGELLVKQGAVSPEQVAQALQQQQAPIGKLLVDMGAASKHAVEQALQLQSKAGEETPEKTVQRRDIRVDVEKLDNLMNLVGELVIAQIMVTHNPDLAGLTLENFERDAHRLARITHELQEVAMALRMVPVSGAFRKMIRLVHDLSAKFKKKVQLVREGEATEIDKTVLETISDPMVHIIRNAVDHGIETPAERLAAGKPETGTVRIEAKHEGGEVRIVISDDGRGLHREKILKKALERGLVSAANADALRDEDVYKLVFEPGFSTAEQVTDVSGRGVGMDVVKKNIEKIKGTVDLRSKPGQGCVFTLRIPLTLAIIEGMLVRVGKSRYTLPLLAIRETLRPERREITRTLDGQEMVNIRGQLVPVMRLHRLHGIEADCRELPEGILIILDSAERSVALFVDEILGQHQTVIKALSRYLGHVSGVSGCTLLEDGTISLILDVGSLLNRQEEAA